ncbi:recombinase family protein [Nonomuraea longicatena]|uniref:recombinase family protein n=1 Tax=Nonomuraea longicatena TaxID=83682 RepID=UPI003CD09A24
MLQVITLRAQGLSLATISRVLNEEGVRTPAGGHVWQKSHVDRLLHTLYARDLLDALNASV